MTKWKKAPVALGRHYSGAKNKLPESIGENKTNVARQNNPDTIKKPSGLVDLQKMTEWLDSHANAKSVGKCAKYVRQALEAGGGDTTGHPVSAKNWGPTLEKMGFKPVPEANYASKLGDVAVFQPRESNGHGHIQAYTSRGWVSDFIQLRFRPNRRDATPYQIYRQP
jgi:hypothetical protein